MSLFDAPLRDPVSSLTHLLTALLGLGLIALLWRLAGGDRTKRISLVCFGACVVILYTASGVYHAIPLPRESPTVEWFRRLDHSAIYVLIAGTYTPVFAVFLRGHRRRRMLFGIWSLAVLGIACKWLLPVAVNVFSVGLYVAMGWVGVVPMMRLFAVVRWRGFLWSFAGGLAYTVGAICELCHWPVIIPGVLGWHEVFHLFDMLGTGLHVMFMVQCIVPHERRRVHPTVAPMVVDRQAA